MTFPLTDLDLSEFHTGLRERAAALAAGAAGVSAEALSSTYNCVAIVNHVGQLKGGHCACLRAPSTPPPPPFARAPRHNPPPTPLSAQTPPPSRRPRRRASCRGRSPSAAGSSSTTPR